MRKIEKIKNGTPKKSKTPINKIQKPSQKADLKEKKLSSKNPLEIFYFITETCSEIIYRMSLPEGRHEYVSPAAPEITGYTPYEFYRKIWFIEDIIHPLYRSQLNDTKNKLAEANVPHRPVISVMSGI